MKKFFLSILSVFTIVMSYSQIITKLNSDSLDFDRKAYYNNGSLHKFLSNKIQYPRTQIENDIQGYVILSFIVTSEGKIDSIIPIEFPSNELAVISVLAVQQTEDNWSPTIINQKPVNWKYKLAIKFSIEEYTVSGQIHDPNDFVLPAKKNEKKGDSFFKKEKYEKAIKYYSLVIESNEYEYEYYLKRSSAFFKIGNIEEGNRDITVAHRLYNEFTGSIGIVALSITRTNR